MLLTQAVPSIPSLEVVNGHPTTLSTQVAEYFGKNHQHVTRDIRNLIEKCPDLGVSNFGQTTYKDSQGKKQPCYRMDRKGFVLLAMGFTGEKALQFKIAYIDAFDRMEAIIQKKAISKAVSNLEITTLTPEQQYELKEAVKSLAKKSATNYQTIYRAIYARYKIARYEQLPQAKLEDCLNFIKTLDLRVPEQSKPVTPNRYPAYDADGCCPYCGLKAIPEGSKILTKEHQRALFAKIKLLLDDAEQSMRIIEKERCHAWTCYHELRLLLIGIC